uniref:Uncharacterized protein n=1 Tax=Arundo donax TaxID=35708 RepID=A0A0A8ZSN7_ARUDO
MVGYDPNKFVSSSEASYWIQYRLYSLFIWRVICSDCNSVYGT